MSKTEAKEEIKRLVETYNQVKKSGGIKKYNEAETCKEFILPLFKALGWDTDSKSEVSAEEHTSATDRADYGFYINGWAKFYLEAKKLSANIQDDRFAKQAIGYSWNKGITWAVLTDFESLIVFNSQDNSGSLLHKQIFEIKYDEYLTRFDELLLLARDSFIKNLLDKYAERHGKKLQRVSVTDALYKDLNESRLLLLKSFGAWNKAVPADLLEEGVQKLLDRLIFIRVAEDRGLEQSTLTSMLRKFGGSSNERFYESLVAKFRDLDKIYNSNLFTPHPLENWQEYDGATEKVIKILHGQSSLYEYDFQAIPADVLGSVYENYLGYKLSQSNKGMEVSKDSRKRKEQGIYYTPTYIVDYIVTNALKPALDKCESVQDLKAVKVLDPACGSGSFLIRVVEMIYQKYLEFGANPGEMTKITILLDNIYGVDLDEQAVEIARLNLLINALDSRMRLPDLSKNIKNGNSLIGGTDAELEKAFGKNYRDKKPFNWQEKFPQVFDRKNPGFDVIIGNPPWGAELPTEDKKFIKDSFSSSQGIMDTFALFTEQGLLRLREDGMLAFVLPDIVLLKAYPSIRKYLLDHSQIKNIVQWGQAFKDANIDAISLVTRKTDRPTPDYSIDVIRGLTAADVGSGISSKINAQVFKDNTDYRFNIYLDEPVKSLLSKLDSDNESLGHYFEVHEGIHSGNVRKKLFVDEAINKSSQRLIFGRNEIGRYALNWSGKFVNYDKSIIDKSAGEYANIAHERYFEQPKLLVRRTGDHIVAAVDYDNFYCSNNLFVLLPKSSNINLKYVLGLLNSSAMTWYFRAIQPRVGKLFAELKINHLNQFPIKKSDTTNTELVVDLVDRMINIKKQLGDELENSNKWTSLKSEIDKIDHQIDQLVYRLYNLNSEEIKIVRESTQK